MKTHRPFVLGDTLYSSEGDATGWKYDTLKLSGREPPTASLGASTSSPSNSTVLGSRLCSVSFNVHHRTLPAPDASVLVATVMNRRARSPGDDAFWATMWILQHSMWRQSRLED